MLWSDASQLHPGLVRVAGPGQHWPGLVSQGGQPVGGSTDYSSCTERLVVTDQVRVSRVGGASQADRGEQSAQARQAAASHGE
eukprot:6089529-Alexandrium_andersonii.AAC.1